MTIELVNEAVMAGARRESACEIVGLSARTLERWRGNHVEDMRRGPKTAPANKLTAEERAAIAYFASFHQSPREADATAAATLRGLLERME